MYTGNQGITRDFVATCLVVDHDKVLLLFHRKLRRWLPPGGHIDPPELPDTAALREVYEETGITAEIVADYEPEGFEHALARPAGIQLEDIEPGHQHIDLLYFGRPSGGTELTKNDESEAIGWYTIEQMKAMNVTEEVIAWSEKAIRAVNLANDRC